MSFGAIHYGIDSQMTEQHTRQVKPVQVNSAVSKVRTGKIKGMNNRIISYSYRNRSATKPLITKQKDARLMYTIDTQWTHSQQHSEAVTA